MGSTHSIIPPSSAARRVQCPGSAMLELMHPETEETEASREGTASHELAERMIDSLSRAGVGFPSRADTVGTAASNGVIWEDDSYDGAKLYADTVAATMQKTGVFGGENCGAEYRVYAERIHSESWGTCDHYLYDQKRNTLYVDDYKFGRNVVEAFECWQLIIYAIGLIDEIDALHPGVEQTMNVVLRITQPQAWHRDGSVRAWTVSAGELRAYASQMAAVEAEALGPDPAFRTGPECKYCTGRHACETLQRAVYSFDEFVRSPANVELSPAALSLELHIVQGIAELAGARAVGLEAQIVAALNRGDTVPGWEQRPGRGSTQWSQDDATVQGLGEMYGVDLRKQGVCTPLQAIAKGIDESVISAYSTKSPGALKLVPIDSNRVKEIFK